MQVYKIKQFNIIIYQDGADRRHTIILYGQRHVLQFYSTEAAFLDVIVTKVLRVFRLAITVTSTNGFCSLPPPSPEQNEIVRSWIRLQCELNKFLWTYQCTIFVTNAKYCTLNCDLLHHATICCQKASTISLKIVVRKDQYQVYIYIY